MAIINMQCKTCRKDFLYLEIPSKKRKFCSVKCIRYTADKEKLKTHKGKGFWQTATYEEKWNKIKNEFERLVIKKEGCWSWKNKSLTNGYVKINIGRSKSILGHRISWIIHNGKIDNKLFVLHKCDNPQCTNPEHLFLGTPKDNSQDCLNKNRKNVAKGSNHYNVKLTEIDVIKIKELLKLGYSQRKLAKIFNISSSNIQNIADGKIWKDI